MDCSHIGPSVNEISLVFTNDSEIKKLNSYYRGKNKPTDVLSFSQLEGRTMHGGNSLGDLVISVQRAKMQASEFGVSFKEEILRLMVHGILHLLGYDHERVPRKEARRMFALQDRIVAEIGSI